MKLSSSAGSCRSVSKSSSSSCYRPPLYRITPCAPGLPTLRISSLLYRNNTYFRSLLVTCAVRKGSHDSMNPDLDDIQLDDAYYAEIGMTRAEASRQQKQMLYDIDPDAVLLDDIAKVDESLPEEWREAIESLEVYGPKALLMAGFRAEEYAVARATLDQLGADQIKILPVTQDMLQGPLDMALSTPEIDWSAPRPPDWILGGSWGSQRCIMFSGLSLKAQATILEYLEAQGVPQVCVTMALKEDGHKRLGELMAAAVQAQRSMKAPKIAPWEVPRQSSATAAAAAAAAAAATPSSSSSSNSANSTKQGIDFSNLPGKRGPLFSRRPAAAAARGSSSSSSSSSGRLNDEGLEDLQDLVTPEMAKQRLKVNAADINKELTDVIDMELTEEVDSTQQQGSSGSSSSSGAYKVPGFHQDPEALSDWFHDESTGKTVELPWAEDQPAAAAAAAAAGMGAGTSSSRALDLGLDISLDDLLPSRYQFVQAESPSPPAAAAAATQPGSSSSNGADPITAAAASRFLDPSESDGGSVFSAIQSALRSGVDPDQLKQLIDAAAAASAAARDPVDLLLNDDIATQHNAQQNANAGKTSGSSSSSSSSKLSSSDAKRPDRPLAAAVAGPAAAAAAEARPPVQAYGPQPPPLGAEFSGSQKPGVFESDPLLKLRPEIERAFQNNQIKFVDMNKMPKKVRQHYTQEALQQRTQQRQQSYFQQQQQQQQEQQGAQPSRNSISKQQRQRWWQQQRSRQQQQLLQGLKSGPVGSGGKIVEMDVAGGIADLPQQQQQQQQRSSSHSGGNVRQRGAYMQPAAAAADMTNDTGGNNSSSTTDVDMYDNQIDDTLFTDAELVGEFEGDPLESLRFSESQLQDLVDTSRSEGLDPTRALAQAIAFGVQVDPEVAEAVGVDLPSPDLIESARKDIVGSIREMQQDQALDADSTFIMGEEGYQGIAADKVKSRGSKDVGTDSPDLSELSDLSADQQDHELAAVPIVAVNTSTGSGRVWGVGLSSAVSRAKARLAAKKRQQQ